MTARILIVDDLPTNLKLLEAKLTNEYYDVVLAKSGHEALEILKYDQKFDVVLLDVMMPEMDGFEACRLIKANPVTANMPIIMVTAPDFRSFWIEQALKAFVYKGFGFLGTTLNSIY